MQYRKSELYRLEGPELMSLMNNILKMYEAINAVNNERSAAQKRINEINKKIDFEVKWTIGTKSIKIPCVMSLGIAVLLWIIRFLGRWIESRMQGTAMFEGLPAVAVYKIITKILQESIKPSLLIFVIVFIIMFIIKWGDDKYRGKIKDMVWDKYEDEWILEGEKYCKANERYNAIIEQEIYEIAEIIIPESFQYYGGVCELVQAMNDYRAYNISRAVAIVKEERYRREMLAEQRRQNEELARMARQQEQYAREAEWHNREMEQAARETAYYAERTARAEEEQARIARESRW